MPPSSHRCCTSCTRETSSSGGMSLHRQSCKKYKAHMLAVWKLKNHAVVLARTKSNSTSGLAQTPPSEQLEPECSHGMQIDNIVSLRIFTGSSECSDSCLNSWIHLALTQTLRQHHYHPHSCLLHHHPLPILYPPRCLCQHLLHLLNNWSQTVVCK